MLLSWIRQFGWGKPRRDRLAEERHLPSLGEMRVAKALGQHRRRGEARGADAALRLEAEMAGVLLEN